MEDTRNWEDPLIHVQSKKSLIGGTLDDGDIPDLPPEIIEGILKRLPVKSLLKFRCVSKSWLSLICSPEFIKTHLNFSTNNPRIMYTMKEPNLHLRDCSLNSLLLEHQTVASLSTNYPIKAPYRMVSVVGSCNGVSCVAMDINIKKDIFLWNPSMRASKKLPPLAVEMKECFYYTHSFGFSKCDDDYKVVAIFCVVHRNGVNESRTNIYSLKADSWKTIKDFNTGVPLDRSGKYASGKLHFTTNSDFRRNIVSIDLRSEEWGMVEQPNYGEGRSSVMLLGVLDGCLCVISNYQEVRGDVWVLKEYNVKESWTKVFSIPYTNALGKFLYKDPFIMLPNGEVLLVCGMHFVVYNPKDNSLLLLQTTNAKHTIAANIYVESLVSL